VTSCCGSSSPRLLHRRKLRCLSTEGGPRGARALPRMDPGRLTRRQVCGIVGAMGTEPHLSELTTSDAQAVLATDGTPVQIRVVADDSIACPKCGAYWGHPDPALDFPNRFKVDDFCRCYNPKCSVRFYTGEIEEASK
jgi:hypothetical protein